MNYIRELEAEKAHSDGIAAAAAMWMKRAQQAERTLAIVVYAAGGEIVVHPYHVEEANRIELMRDERPHDRTTRFRARLAAAA